MNWKNKRVFVSGGAGVIGNALVERLIEFGADILVGDLKPLPPKWHGKLRYREGDLVDMRHQEIEEFSPEVFFHLAATFERSEETAGFWEENFHHNILLSHHLMSLLKDLSSLKKVIFASSYLIYDPSLYLFPTATTQPKNLKETSAIFPRNLCGMAKLQHEEELLFVKKFHPHLQTISARIFRSYGKNSRDIISRWVRALLKGETITVFRPEGKFDYIYAEDVATGLIKLAETNFSGAINLGSGHARAVQDVISILQTHFPQMKIVTGESQIPFESSQANMEQFYLETNWHAFRPLEKTIPDIIEFEKSQSIPKLGYEP